MSQDAGGKAVTTPKYMAMLVRCTVAERDPGQLGATPAPSARLQQLATFEWPPPLPPTPSLPLQQDIANRRRTTLDVDLDDLDEFSKDPELVEHVERNTQQYLSLLAEAADNSMPAPTDDDLPEDVFDVLLDQVRQGGGWAAWSVCGNRRCVCRGAGAGAALG